MVRLGMGVAAGPDPLVLAGLAPAAEDLGFASVWCNDHPGGEGLLQLAVWCQRSDQVKLGVGVLALDRHDVDGIARRVHELELPPARLLLGIGAGHSRRPVADTREGIRRLRELLPGYTLVVAAMGPAMCRLAGEVADGVLLNWMTPERARWARERLDEGRARFQREDPVRVYAYVRAALGADSVERVSRESTTYAQMPHYARHFQAMGARPEELGIAATNPSEVAARLKAYDALDEPVVRVLSHRALTDVLAVARAAVGA